MGVGRVREWEVLAHCDGCSRRPVSIRSGFSTETLACLETAEAMGFVGPMDPELGALFHRVIGTLVRLVEPRH